MKTLPEQPASSTSSRAPPAFGPARALPGALEATAPDRCWTRLAPAEWGVVALLFFSAGFAAWSARHLWADGAYFFVEMVAHGTFSVPDPAREHARYLTQGPAVLLMAAGVRDDRALSVVFGLGHLLPAPAALLTFLLLAPADAWLVRCAGLAACALSVATSVFAVSEALVLGATALPLLAVAYLHPRRTSLLGAAALLHLVAVRSYQLYPVAALFVLHAAWVAFRRGGLGRGARALWIVHTALALAGSAAAIWSVASIRAAPNTAFAFHTLLAGLRHPPIAFLAVVAVASLAAARAPRLTWVAEVLVVGCAAMAAVPWVSPSSNDPFLAYLARGTGAALGISAVGVCCALHAVGWPRRRPAAAAARPWARVVVGPALLLMVLSWDLSSTVEWRGFRDVFQGELQRLAGCGVVPVMDTLAWRERVGLQMLRRYTWFWSSPYLVAALAPRGPISVVLSNPSASADPLFRGPAPNLSRVGKRWDFEGRTCAATVERP